MLAAPTVLCRAPHYKSYDGEISAINVKQGITSQEATHLRSLLGHSGEEECALHDSVFFGTFFRKVSDDDEYKEGDSDVGPSVPCKDLEEELEKFFGETCCSTHQDDGKAFCFAGLTFRGTMNRVDGWTISATNSSQARIPAAASSALLAGRARPLRRLLRSAQGTQMSITIHEESFELTATKLNGMLTSSKTFTDRMVEFVMIALSLSHLPNSGNSNYVF